MAKLQQPKRAPNIRGLVARGAKVRGSVANAASSLADLHSDLRIQPEPIEPTETPSLADLHGDLRIAPAETERGGPVLTLPTESSRGAV